MFLIKETKSTKTKGYNDTFDFYKNKTIDFKDSIIKIKKEAKKEKNIPNTFIQQKTCVKIL